MDRAIPLMAIPQPSDDVRQFLAQAGAKGGQKLTPKKLAHLRKLSQGGSRALPPRSRPSEVPPQKLVASEEVRRFMAAAGALGGKTVTPKKRAHLSAIASKGGKSLSPKKLAQLQAMREKRWAQQRAEGDQSSLSNARHAPR
jgi:hypothetical protein